MKVRVVIAQSVGFLSVSLNGWTSPNGISVVTVFIHGAAKGKMFKVGIRFIRIHVSHTGQVIAEAVRELLVAHDIAAHVGPLFSGSVPLMLKLGGTGHFIYR